MPAVAKSVSGVGRLTFDVGQIGLAAAVVRPVEPAGRQVGFACPPAVVEGLNVGVAAEIPVKEAVRLTAAVLTPAGRGVVPISCRTRRPAVVSPSVNVGPV